MQELCRTNDAVKLSFIEALLKDAQIPYSIADAHFSTMEGTLAPFPRRVLVETDYLQRAIRVLDDARIER